MIASSDKSLPNNTFTAKALGEQELVHSAVLYGPNASGKSNLIDAIGFIKNFVMQSAKDTPDAPIDVQPFRLDRENRQSPTEFEITFIQQEVRYQYGFAVDRHRVQAEWLIAYPKGRSQTWFERNVVPDTNEYEWYFGSNLKGEKKRLEALTKPNSLFLSVAATFNHEQLSGVYRWFFERLTVIDINRMLDRLEEFTATLVAEDDVFYYEIIRTLLKLADLGIVDFLVEQQIPPTSAIGDEFLAIQMQHQTKDPSAPEILFPIQDESLGTRRLFALGGPWVEALAENYILLVDELDTSLHPAIIKELVKMFHEVSNNAQLIFNTHDVTLLDSSLFRRDQVWFVEKDKGGVSHLYPLLEFSPRKGEALAKGYLQGRYGAIPFLREDLWRGFLFNGKG